MSRPGFLVIEHEDECPPEWFGLWWEQAGIALRRIRAHDGEPIPGSIADAAALIVLGGEAGANDDGDYPWLPATRRLIGDTVAAGQPFLGICLGHQLACVALGGEVAPNPHGHATGLTPVTLTAAGAGDPLLASFAGTRAVQWNNDVAVRLPPTGTVLATAPDGTPQAVRFADRAWGVQFHPEVSPEQFDRWTIDKPSAMQARTDGIDVYAASRAVHAARAELQRTWQPLARRFAELALAGTSWE
ncbi:MAG: type 1 glutamine amidotransferase [Tetrasphaera sp.]